MTSFDLITKQDLAEFKKLNIGRAEDKGQPQWLRSKQVRAMLNISPGTLQNFRIKGILPSKKVGGILYYESADITELMKKGDQL